jgi:hypothetical protein
MSADGYEDKLESQRSIELHDVLTIFDDLVTKCEGENRLET